MMTIEGIPDGWIQERVGQIHPGEYWVNNYGDPQRWENDHPSSSKNYVIIRKIEKPKQYRPYAKLIEAQPLVGEVLRFKVNHQSMALFIGITSSGFQINLSHWNPREAFDSFERLDGTPFGIEVKDDDEET